MTATCSLNLLFFPMWIEQILQVLFVAKAVGSVAFVSVSFLSNACIYRLLAEPDNLLNISMKIHSKAGYFGRVSLVKKPAKT